MGTPNKRATVLLPHQIADLNAGELVHYCDAMGLSTDPIVSALLEWILCREAAIESEEALEDRESELLDREMNFDAGAEEKANTAIRDYFVYTRDVRILVEDYFHADKNIDADTLDQLLNEIEDCEFSVPPFKKVAPTPAPKRPGAKMMALPVVLKIVRAANKPIPVKEVIALAGVQQISRSAAYASIKSAVSSGLLVSEHGLIRPNTP